LAWSSTWPSAPRTRFSLHRHQLRGLLITSPESPSFPSCECNHPTVSRTNYVGRVFVASYIDRLRRDWSLGFLY
jgi:hypothetical protein